MSIKDKKVSNNTNVKKSLFGGTTKTMVEFRCPVARWKVDGKKFTGAVPLRFREIKQSNVFGSSTTWELDEEEMRVELVKMVQDSRDGKVQDPMSRTL